MKSFYRLLPRFSLVSLLSFMSFPAIAANISVEFIDQGIINAGEIFEGTTVGEFSGISYSGTGNTYYAISDDENNPRFYTLNIDVDLRISQVNPTITGVQTLKDDSGTVLGNNTVDGEGIAVLGNDLFVASEGIFTGGSQLNPDAGVLSINPFINRFDIVSGNQNLALNLNSRYLIPNSTQTEGVRENLSFESLTITPDQTKLFTALETPLKQDQTLTDISPFGNALSPLVRILEYEETGDNYTAGAEYIYEVDSVHGLVELVALDHDTLLALERNVNPLDPLNEPYGVRLYQVSLPGATDVSNNDGLIANPNGIINASKTLLLDFSTIPGNPLDPIGNFEGLTLGETLPNGERLLLAVSDNNFSDTIPTKFAAFSVEISSQSVPESSTIMGLLFLGLGFFVIPKASKLF
ncbi:MAG: esterase-like activity of phytase family protein [Crocosphaera sp.]|nr:esterase-like activity of phytase family protein [Crocosphaera sp.]